jgi:trk system potassium uptake protein
LPDLRLVLFIVGVLLLGLAAAMLLPALVDSIDGSPDWRAFLTALAITAAVGGVLVLGFRQPAPAGLSVRAGFLLTVLAAIALALFAALPFMLAGVRLGFADAAFEAMSGLTTTGATVLTHLDQQSRGLLLWRALLHLGGGLGAIFMAVAILPVLRVGGMQLFRTESSDRLERIRPRVSQVSVLLVAIYLGLTALCALALLATGMDGFDAICHAMATVSTGGFSTHDASIGFFDSPAIEAVVAVFMILGGATFLLLARAAQGDWRSPWRDTQLRWYLAYMALFAAAVALWQAAGNGRPALAAIRSSLFTVASVATTTGFFSENYALWGTLPVAAVLTLCFVGGCTGSAAGGLKVFRFCVLGNAAHWQLRHLVHPHRMLPLTYNGQPVGDEVLRSVFCFVAFYIACFALLALAVAACGLDLVTSLSGVAAALGNVGPGLGHLIGPGGSYALLPSAAKWLLALAMLLGRLEVLTVLVLFSPTFWRG